MRRTSWSVRCANSASRPPPRALWPWPCAATTAAAVGMPTETGKAYLIGGQPRAVRVEPDRARTAADADEVARPCVNARVHELFNHDFAQDSRLRECAVEIQAQTDYADDKGQVVLSTLAHYVSAWILSPPTLSLASCTFRRLSLPEQPRRDETIDRVQLVTWNVVVGVFTTS